MTSDTDRLDALEALVREQGEEIRRLRGAMQEMRYPMVASYADGQRVVLSGVSGGTSPGWNFVGWSPFPMRDPADACRDEERLEAAIRERSAEGGDGP